MAHQVIQISPEMAALSQHLELLIQQVAAKAAMAERIRQEAAAAPEDILTEAALQTNQVFLAAAAQAAAALVPELVLPLVVMEDAEAVQVLRAKVMKVLEALTHLVAHRLVAKVAQAAAKAVLPAAAAAKVYCDVITAVLVMAAVLAPLAPLGLCILDLTQMSIHQQVLILLTYLSVVFLTMQQTHMQIYIEMVTAKAPQ